MLLRFKNSVCKHPTLHGSFMKSLFLTDTQYQLCTRDFSRTLLPQRPHICPRHACLYAPSKYRYLVRTTRSACMLIILWRSALPYLKDLCKVEHIQNERYGSTECNVLPLRQEKYANSVFKLDLFRNGQVQANILQSQQVERSCEFQLLHSDAMSLAS